MTKDNEYCISVKQLIKDRGFNDETDLVLSCGIGNMVPACCKMGCEVESNGTCQHGCPSILMAIGIRNMWKVLMKNR